MATYGRITSKILELSNADDYEEAKKEWRITGNVWRHGVNEESRLGYSVRDHVSGHPNSCLCGHDIVYHFEIENTENGTKEIVGSTCIGNWMVLRHIEEKMKIDRRNITEKMIEDWKTSAVQSLIKDAWWEENGEEFTNTFDEIKELDLRINVKKTGKTYWEESVKDYRPETFIRKSSSGLYGSPTYEMASIVWRWNHPDNPRRQRDSKRGTPNNKLMEDLVLFKVYMQKHLDVINSIDSIDSNRIIHLGNVDSYIAKKLVTVNDNDLDQRRFLHGCQFFGIRPFTTGESQNDWERRFLRDMRRRIVRLERPSVKQCDSLINILRRRSDVILVSTTEE